MSDLLPRFDRYDEDFSGLYVDPDGAYCLYNHVEKLQRELASKEKECAELRNALSQVAQSHAWLAFGECRSYGAEAPLLSPSEADYAARTVLEKYRNGE